MSDDPFKDDHKYMCKDTFKLISETRPGQSVVYYSGDMVPNNVKCAVRVAYNGGLGSPVRKKLALNQYDYLFQRTSS